MSAKHDTDEIGLVEPANGNGTTQEALDELFAAIEHLEEGHLTLGRLMKYNIRATQMVAAAIDKLVIQHFHLEKKVDLAVEKLEQLLARMSNG